jgi:DNA-binding IclR family transcriptional regulator
LKSSAFALLQTLVARGFVADSGARLTRRYRLGMALAKLGDAAEMQSPLISVAMPVLQSVTDATGLTTRRVVPDGPFAVVIGRVRARVPCGSPATWVRRMDELGTAMRDASDQITMALGGPPSADRAKVILDAWPPTPRQQRPVPAP